MPNDQLTRAERVRLESLSQSIAMTMLVSRPGSQTIDNVLLRAENIEAWLLKATAGMQ